MFFSKSHIKLELLTSKTRAHIKKKNDQNVSGEMLLLCRVLWASSFRVWLRTTKDKDQYFKIKDTGHYLYIKSQVQR